MEVLVPVPGTFGIQCNPLENIHIFIECADREGSGR